MASAVSPHSLGDPFTPIYPLSDAARYLGFSHQRTRYWLGLVPGRTATPGMENTASFLALVSMLVMKALRDIGITAKKIHLANAYLHRQLGPYPLARAHIWTDGAHILFSRESPLSLEQPRDLESADMGGQRAFVKILEIYLHRVEYDQQKRWVAAWFPRACIRLDPRIQFGEPCIEGTRVRTSALYSGHRAGESIAGLAGAFGVSEDAVEQAIRWESELHRKAA